MDPRWRIRSYENETEFLMNLASKCPEVYARLAETNRRRGALGWDLLEGLLDMFVLEEISDPFEMRS